MPVDLVHNAPYAGVHVGLYADTSGFDRAAPMNFTAADVKMLDDDTGFRSVVAADAMQALQAA